MALDALSDANKTSDKEVLDMTREIVKATFRGEVGAKLAIGVANGVRLQRISEYKDSIRQARATPFTIFLFLLLRRFERGEVEARANAQERAAA